MLARPQVDENSFPHGLELDGRLQKLNVIYQRNLTFLVRQGYKGIENSRTDLVSKHTCFRYQKGLILHVAL